MTCFMGVDVGTQAVKAGLFDSKGKLLSIASIAYKNETKYPYINWETQKPEDWWDSLKKVVHDCVTFADVDAKEIIAMSVDSTSSTLVMVDKLGGCLDDAILWSDRRAIKQSQKIQRKIEEFYFDYFTGVAIPEMTLPKILWLKENDRKYYECDKILEQGNWLMGKLTGEFSASRLTLIRFANYLAKIEGWPEGFLKNIGLEDLHSKLPSKVERPGTVLGEILPELADEFGLSKKTIIVEAGNDAYISQLGMGVHKSRQMGMILGSSTPYKIILDKNIVNDGFFGPFYDLLMPGKYFLGTSLASAGTIANWVVDNSKYNNLDRKKAYDMLSKKAEKIYPGSDGLFCFPFCNGVRSPVVNSTARGAFIGFDLSHKTEHLLRAVYEGISYSIRHSLESLEASNFIVKDISVCGGGSKSSLLTHILADVVGKPLHISFPEASLLGSAICAAVGAERYKNLDEAISYMVHPTGVILPDTTNHEVYSDYFEKYKLSFYDIFAKEVAA